MQQDAVIWEVIRHNHCSFMAKLETGNFCRNPYNVTGICNRSSCPLANSRYATIREHEGVFYLYMKTIERAHTPNKLWERVKLPQNYMKALEVIDKHLMYWPKLLVHKIKQRLTKMTQMRIRMRKLALKTREKIMTTPRKDTKRESRREEKAEKAACIERKIEQELIARIKQGVYGEIYNYPESKFRQILDGLDKVELNSEYEKEEEEEEEQEVEYVEGFDELEEELEEDMEDFGLYSINEPLKNQGLLSDDDGDIEMVDNKKLKRKSASGRDKSEKYESGKLKKLTKVLVEVEDEDTSARQTALAHR